MARLCSVVFLITATGFTGCAAIAGGDVAVSGSERGAVAANVAGWYTHEGAEKLYRQARYKEAEEMCKAAIASIEKARGPKAWELAEPLNDLATVYLRQARWSDAKAVLDRAESVLDPEVPEQALILGRMGINKGWRLYSLGEAAGAQKAFEDARTLLEKNTKGESKDLAEIINNLALMYEETARDEDDSARMSQARRMLLQAWQMRRKLTGDASYETAESLNNLGMYLLYNSESRDDVNLAVKTLEKALDVTRKAYGEENPETAMSRTNLASAYLLTEKTDLAEKEIRQAIPVTQRFLGDKHPDRAYELGVLGRVLQEQTHFDEAEKLFIEAVSINETVYGKNHPNVASALEYLARLYEERGEEAKGQAVQKRIEQLSGKGI
jgi:hypothetical protein